MRCVHENEGDVVVKLFIHRRGETYGTDPWSFIHLKGSFLKHGENGGLHFVVFGQEFSLEMWGGILEGDSTSGGGVFRVKPWLNVYHIITACN